MPDRGRPFYHQFAWAYDLLQTEDVAARVDFVQSVLRKHGVADGSTILDAGCGTGRYTVELMSHGYGVTGVDQSREFIAIACKRYPRIPFVTADLTAIVFTYPYNAILCRGVLNDIVDDDDRRTVFEKFSEWLRVDGVLIFDVREWETTAARKSASPAEQRRVALPNGTLEFQSETALDLHTRRLLVHERFDLQQNGVRTSTESDFVMRCWTREEIHACLSHAGLEEIAVSRGYGPQDSWTDRLVIVAR